MSKYSNYLPFVLFTMACLEYFYYKDMVSSVIFTCASSIGYILVDGFDKMISKKK